MGKTSVSLYTFEDMEDKKVMFYVDAYQRGYRWTEGQVKDLGAVSGYGSFYYKEKGNLMMGYSLSRGYNSTGADGEREYVHTFFDNSLSGENPIVYKIDEQEVSKSEYDQKKSELEKNMSVLTLDSLPDVNDANIAAQIG